MRCGGIFNKHFAANLLENLTVEKKFENRLIINGPTATRLLSLFWNTVYLLTKLEVNEFKYMLRNGSVDTDGWWSRASDRLQTVPAHRWWQVDERLYVVSDTVVQRLTTPRCWSEVCSSRSLTQCTWSRLDTLNSGSCELHPSVRLQ